MSRILHAGCLLEFRSRFPASRPRVGWFRPHTGAARVVTGRADIWHTRRSNLHTGGCRQPCSPPRPRSTTSAERSAGAPTALLPTARGRGCPTPHGHQSSPGISSNLNGQRVRHRRSTTPPCPRPCRLLLAAAPPASAERALPEAASVATAAAASPIGAERRRATSSAKLRSWPPPSCWGSLLAALAAGLLGCLAAGVLSP